MRKLIGYLVLAFVMLVPFRMVYLETGEHSNMISVILFLSVLFGAFAGGYLIESKN
jgi:hypothetical protein